MCSTFISTLKSKRSPTCVAVSPKTVLKLSFANAVKMMTQSRAPSQQLYSRAVCLLHTWSLYSGFSENFKYLMYTSIQSATF